MIPDTTKIYLRHLSSPYTIIDSTTGVLNLNGVGTFKFYNPINGILYFIVITHRNSIETWSSSGNSFTLNSLSYNFTASSFQAFGNNLILKGTKYCIYSGDVNQDGIIDASDLSLVDNDVFNSVSGYVLTDVNGDNFVDASDLSIVDNNAFNSVIMRRP